LAFEFSEYIYVNSIYMKNKNFNWDQEFAGAVTVCDTDGIILYMNKKALSDFEDDGGTDLLGTNVLDCHPEPSKTQLKEMLEKQQENTYTVEKNGTKKLIYQGPWYREEVYCGIVELSIELPDEIKNIVR
jgi:transcriptional regulator with PAS, ATPase and Fis domain